MPYPAKRVNDKAAHLPGVKWKCKLEAEKLAEKARAKLLRHHKRGRHHITVETRRLDSHVVLVGPAALALEVGHFTKNGKWVEGIHVLRFRDG